MYPQEARSASRVWRLAVVALKADNRLGRNTRRAKADVVASGDGNSDRLLRNHSRQVIERRRKSPITAKNLKKTKHRLNIRNDAPSDVSASANVS
jgi:hypothetical protein